MNKMSTKHEKRKTKQVRINIKWHKVLKENSAKHRITVAKLLDKIVSEYFKK